MSSKVKAFCVCALLFVLSFFLLYRSSFSPITYTEGKAFAHFTGTDSQGINYDINLDEETLRAIIDAVNAAPWKREIHFSSVPPIKTYPVTDSVAVHASLYSPRAALDIFASPSLELVTLTVNSFQYERYHIHDKTLAQQIYTLCLE